MAGRIDLQRLQRQLDAFQSKFQHWAKHTVASTEGIRDGHLGRLRELQATIRGLEQRQADLERQAAEVQTRLADEHSELTCLREQLASIVAEQNKLPTLVAEVEEALAAETVAFKQQEAALSDQEALKERKLSALHQALTMYRHRLGLDFVHGAGDGEQLHVVLTHIDPRDHARPFRFAVQVVGDNSYAVQACEPPLPCMEQLLAELNGGSSFSRFVRCMRREFRAAVAAEQQRQQTPQHLQPVAAF